MSNLKATQTGTDQGLLQVNVNSRIDANPIPDATVILSYTGVPDNTLEELKTNSSGQTDRVTLAAPALEYSMEPSETQPYAEYTVQVSAPGYHPINVSGINVLPDVLALQPIRLIPEEMPAPEESNIVISANTLFGNFPPKIPESSIKPTNETGEIVLSRVVIPEYIVVHDGSPTDNTAPNYYVRYRDYIKNVASSEIYATWPDESLKANILAIMSFTLNRVYTEW
ncbi:MAG: carboxypeptidase regulatory-like domain-containing protein [Roseburia sp.]